MYIILLIIVCALYKQSARERASERDRVIAIHQLQHFVAQAKRELPSFVLFSCLFYCLLFEFLALISFPHCSFFRLVLAFGMVDHRHLHCCRARCVCSWYFHLVVESYRRCRYRCDLVLYVANDDSLRKTQFETQPTLRSHSRIYCCNFWPKLMLLR